MNAVSRSELPAATTVPSGRMWPRAGVWSLGVAMAVVIAVLVWQAITSHGTPDPTQNAAGSFSALLNIGVLVFREGLECILVLSAITATMVGEQAAHRRPVALGAGFGFVATVITWFVAIGILSSLTESVSALNLQAATGLVAIVVLLVVMNWFFHKMYWGGWIGLHTRKKKELLSEADGEQANHRRLLWGLGVLGFSSFYREGFEVVLFLQSYRMKLGSNTVLLGALIGTVLTGIVAVVNFVAHRRLPYRKMLVFTGILLGMVLLVMVGEQAQEMQLAHWISTTQIPWLAPVMPDWMGLWFGIFPTVESLLMQGAAATLVIGSYFAASRKPAAASSKQTVAEESFSADTVNANNEASLA